jgi:hypothetical protein
VRPAAFEEEAGPSFAENTGNDSPGRSVIVERDESPGDFRSAQASSAGSGSTSAPGAPSATDSIGRPGSGLQDPAFDTTPDLPPIEPITPEIETPSLPDDTDVAPQEPERQQLQQPGREPSREFQPRVPLGPRDRPGTELPPTPSVPETTIQKEREKSEEACEEGFQKLREKTIDKVDLNISVTGEEGSDFPFECTLGAGEWHGGRCWAQTTYMWKASALCHKPLYFEDEQLERYGHSFTPCFQPFVSGAHFFCRLPVLPYCMGVEPPTECIYALGHYRPGNCAPYMCNPIPISGRAALIQAGAVVGAAAAVP